MRSLAFPPRGRSPSVLRAALVAAGLILAPAAVAPWTAAPAVAADALAQAKAAGLVGEQPDGYLGFVKSPVPADVAALVADVNAKRKAEYEKIARETGTSPQQVGAVTFEKLLKSGRPGYYLI
ncbi:MAG: YdbL family protein, partial [Rhodospirillaceae bacterium]|nr:YdbL family protein [Rhodospirillaceae bacterium]